MESDLQQLKEELHKNSVLVSYLLEQLALLKLDITYLYLQQGINRPVEGLSETNMGNNQAVNPLLEIQHRIKLLVEQLSEMNIGNNESVKQLSEIRLGNKPIVEPLSEIQQQARQTVQSLAEEQQAVNGATELLSNQQQAAGEAPQPVKEIPQTVDYNSKNLSLLRWKLIPHLPPNAKHSSSLNTAKVLLYVYTQHHASYEEMRKATGMSVGGFAKHFSMMRKRQWLDRKAYKQYAISPFSMLFLHQAFAVVRE